MSSGWWLLLLLVTEPAALLAFYVLPRWWAPYDAAVFQADGANNRRHQTFHRQRLTWRLALVVVISLLGEMPVLFAHQHALLWAAYLVASAGLFSLGWTYFFYEFTPRLNLARREGHVGEYYVSQDPEAAWFPDRLLWAWALRYNPHCHEPGCPTCQTFAAVYAAQRLKTWCKLALWLGFGLFGLGHLGGALLFLFH